MSPPRAVRDSATGDLFAALTADDAPPPAAPLTGDALLALLRQWTDAGLLRHIDTALAALLHEQHADSPPCALLAAALLAQMEGRGHSCLPLAPLLQSPLATLAWPPEHADAVDALWAQLPASLPGWLQALTACPWVRTATSDGTPLDDDAGQPLVLVDAAGSAPLLYLRRYWLHEQAVARHITARSSATPAAPVDIGAARGWLERFFAPTPDAAPDWQKIACALALRGQLTLITGGPGTGKTYTAARLLALLFATAAQPDQLRVALAAPTGKAAARLKQSIDEALGALQHSVGSALDLGALVERTGAARTLHALLGARAGTRHFSHHAGNPLEVDVLIVDEASMVHLEMMAALLAALPASARLVLLGDKDQLASVEAGAVLGDLCRGAEAGRYAPATAQWIADLTGEILAPQFLATGATPDPLAQHTVMLRASRRFGGPIGQLAQAVNEGDAAAAGALLQRGRGGGDSGEVALRQGGTPAQAVQLAWPGRAGTPSYGGYAQALARWQPLRASAGQDGFEAAHAAWAANVLRAFERFRLLCAVREGDWGVQGLNRAIEQALAHAGVIAQTGGSWYAGRPVMVTRNEPQLGVFNGDIGIALPGAAPDHALRVYFLQGEQLRSVGVARLAQVQTAFAMTVHKSQGSEFAHAALVLPASAGQLLARELVYTGITRARQAFTLVEQHAGLLAQAIERPTQRASGLARLLRR